MDLAPGTVLLGKYRIDELVGSGGMGNVVRASHLYLHQSVAIKILLPEMARSESTKQRFLREAQATVKLKSEHSARVMDVGTTPEGLPFMVMEYLDGNDLNQILRHHGPQVPSIVVDLMLQACEGIAEAHALGIVHRDVKPSNFFITRRPDGSMLLKILDFGISKTPVDFGELTGTQTVIGTPSYMAPEQMKSGRSVDPRSDIWSMGVVMYQLIAGYPPFSGESYAELVLKVGLEPPMPLQVPLPNGLVEVIMRCLDKDPRRRHQNVGEMARMLAPYATDPISAAQSAGRAMRILQQRGAQLGVQGSPFGGGLTAPISPAQLTPHSWPASQGTSLSQGAGQVTLRPYRNRGLLLAGVVALCGLAGVGGYAVSQVSKPSGRPDNGRNEPHVQAPPPTAAAPAAATPPTAAAAAPNAASPPAASPNDAAPSVAAPNPAERTVAASIAPASPAAAPTAVAPPIAAAPGAAPSAAARTAAPPTATTNPADPKRPITKTARATFDVVTPGVAAHAVARPAPTKPAITKPAVVPPVVTPAVTKPAAATPATGTPAVVNPVSGPKPVIAKPAAKPKKPGDLFDSRH